jgi:iduronate 2-sulfatase
MERRPNVLYLLADDMRPDMAFVSFHTLPIVTPNLNALARRSAYFENTFSQVSLCVPSRASFLSGMRPYATGIVANEQLLRFGSTGALPYAGVSAFRAAGYVTAGIGKIAHRVEAHPDYTMHHMGSTDLLHAPCREASARNRHMYAPHSFESCDIQGDNFRDEVVRRNALYALRSLARGKAPFFIVVGFLRPHEPVHVPTWAMARQPPIAQTELPLRSRVHSAGVFPGARKRDRIPSNQVDTLRVACLKEAPKNASRKTIGDLCVRHARRVYRAAMTYTDGNMGALINELGVLRVSNWTIVVVSKALSK